MLPNVAPPIKFVLLLVVLPWSLSYLHFYHTAFSQSEYCLVGPGPTILSTQSPLYGIYAPEKSSQRGSSSKKFRLKYAARSSTSHIHRHHDHASSFFSFLASPSSLSLSALVRWLLHSSGWPSVTQAAIMISAPSSQLSMYRHYASTYNINNNSSNSNNSNNNSNNNNNDNTHEIRLIETVHGTRWCLQSLSTPDSWCSNLLPLPNIKINHTESSSKHPSDSTTLDHLYPPSGIWEYLSPSLGTTITTLPPTQISINMSCPKPKTAITSNQKQHSNNRHKAQTAKQNRNVQFLLHHPTTVLLLLLQAYLAFQYWNLRVSPNSVAKDYTKICIEHEWWRSFTGATAHFEAMHFGFNSLSLYTLGKELEDSTLGLNSILFMVYNVALVVITTVVMMGIVRVRIAWIQYRAKRVTATTAPNADIQQQQLQRLRDTRAVGYSAVLFAWMVVSTLERNQPTCPIPFFPDVCFATHTVPGIPILKWNVAPIVSLIVAQTIMPRVSFMGHLAGILCGFGLHWGWGMPPLEICSPNVLLGGVFLVGCLGVSRRIVPVRPMIESSVNSGPCCSSHDDGESLELLVEGRVNRSTVRHWFDSLEEESSGDEDVDTNTITEDPINKSKKQQRKRELDDARSKHRTLLSIRNMIGIITITSFFVLDQRSSLVMSQCILLAFFLYGTQATSIVWLHTHRHRVGNDDDIINSEKQRAGIIWRGFFVAATLSIVVDAMSVASWATLQTLISADRYPMRMGMLLAPAYLFMFARITVNTLGLIIASKILFESGQVGGGIFVYVFSWVLSLSKQMGDEIMLLSQRQQRPLWTAFEGRGIRLGSRSN